MGKVRRSPVWDDPRVKPPYGSVEIDWAHPLSPEFCVLCNEAAGSANDIGLRRLRSTADFTQGKWTANTHGVTLQANASATPVMTYTDESLVLPASEVTFAFRSRKTNEGSGAPASNMGVANTGTERGWVSIGYAGDNAFLDWGGTVDGTSRLQISGASSNVGHNAWLASSGSRGMRFMKNGALVGSNGGNSTRTIGTSDFYILGGAGIAADADQMDYAYVYRRQLSDDMGLWLTYEPYAFLRPIIRRRYFVPSAAAATVVRTPHFLTLGVGS